MNRKRSQSERGFSLVEVMVSLVIFLVASVGLLPLLLTNMQANQDNGLHGQARRLAGELMAELQVIDYANLPLAAGETLLFDRITLLPEVEGNTPQAGQSRITVTALWSLRGQSHRYQLQTIRTAP